MLPRNLIVFVPLVLTGLSGCGEADRGAEFAQAVTGEEVYRITNEDDVVDLVLTTESVYMELSEKVLAEVKEELDEERAEGATNTLAGGIKDFVLNGVEKMIQTKIEYQIDEVYEIRWDDGEMIFVVDDNGFLSFDEIEIDGDRPVRAPMDDDRVPWLRSVDRLLQIREVSRNVDLPRHGARNKNAEDQCNRTASLPVPEHGDLPHWFAGRPCPGF